MSGAAINEAEERLIPQANSAEEGTRPTIPIMTKPKPFRAFNRDRSRGYLQVLARSTVP